MKARASAIVLSALLGAAPSSSESILEHYLNLNGGFEKFGSRPESVLRLDQDVEGDGVAETFLGWAGMRGRNREWAVYSERSGRACFLGWTRVEGNYFLPAADGRRLRMEYWRNETERVGGEVEFDVRNGEIFFLPAEPQAPAGRRPAEAIRLDLRSASLRGLREAISSQGEERWSPTGMSPKGLRSVVSSSSSTSAASGRQILRCGTLEALARRSESMGEHFRRVQLDPMNRGEPPVLQRVDIDLDADGSKEVLLSAPDPGVMYGAGGSLWQVYSRKGTEVCWAGSMVMNVKTSRFDQGRSALVVNYPDSPRWSWERLYRLEQGKISRHDGRVPKPADDLRPEEAARAAAADYWSGPDAPRLLSAPASELLRGGGPSGETWKTETGETVEVLIKVGGSGGSASTAPFAPVDPCS